MGTRQPARQVGPRSIAIPNHLEKAALDHGVRLIHQVCCFAGSFELLDEFRDRDLCGAIERHDSAALFDRLMPSRPFSLGSSNSPSGGIAASKASTFATATGSMTGNGAKTAIAACTPSATELA
jgi:hypothetical protein